MASPSAYRLFHSRQHPDVVAFPSLARARARPREDAGRLGCRSLDAAAVKAAVGRIRPDAVINELTSLPRHYTPAEMKAAAERDHKVRVEGNINLLAALRDAGVRRYLLQSSSFWYAPGAGLADESVPFISSASPGVEASARTYMELAARACARPRARGHRKSKTVAGRQGRALYGLGSRAAYLRSLGVPRALGRHGNADTLLPSRKTLSLRAALRSVG